MTYVISKVIFRRLMSFWSVVSSWHWFCTTCGSRGRCGTCRHDSSYQEASFRICSLLQQALPRVSFISVRCVDIFIFCQVCWHIHILSGVLTCSYFVRCVDMFIFCQVCWHVHILSGVLTYSYFVRCVDIFIFCQVCWHIHILSGVLTYSYFVRCVDIFFEVWVDV